MRSYSSGSLLSSAMSRARQQEEEDRRGEFVSQAKRNEEEIENSKFVSYAMRNEEETS